MSSKREFSAGGVVVRGDECIVIVPRKRSQQGDLVLGLPKGHPDGAETPEEAAAREVREETGVEIDVEGLAGIAERIVPDDEGKVEYHYVILDFWAKPRSKELTPGDDASEARWVNVADLTEYELTAGLYEFLQDRDALEGRRPRVTT